MDWAWYAGGWSNAAGDVGRAGLDERLELGTCTDPNHDPAAIVYPHCPDNTSSSSTISRSTTSRTTLPARPARTHLRDEVAFQQAAASSDHRCNLKQVSFVKPIGEENEHPATRASRTARTISSSLLQSIEGTACAKDTMIIVTYDEFGGQWDHVTPPGQGGVSGPHDQWGPGTRIPALIVDAVPARQRA